MTGTTKSGAKVEIRCPRCGGTEMFWYIEDIVNHRDVEGFNEHGVLQIGGFYETGDGYDDGTNPRLECRNDVLFCQETHQHKYLCYSNCGHEFPIPDGIKIDFV